MSERCVLQDGQLREWIAPDQAVSGDAVAKIMQAMQASRLFRREVERDVLGKEQPVIGFRHELIGKFLAARHVRRMNAARRHRIWGPDALPWGALSDPPEPS